MKLSCRSLAVVIVLVAPRASSADAAYLIAVSDFLPTPQVITFETGTTALPTIPGVTFDERISLRYGGDATFNRPNQFFGEQSYGNLHDALGYTTLAIDFATPQQGVGAYLERILLQSASPSVTTSVYGVGGVLLGQYSLDLQPNVLTFVGLADERGITRIEWSPLYTAIGALEVDNVTFGAVPEPASIALAACGLPIVLVLARRRRRVA